MGGRRLLVVGYVAAMVVVGCTAYALLVVPRATTSALSGEVLIWAAVVGAGFATTELVVLRLWYGSSAFQWTLMEVPLVLGLYFLPAQLLVPLHVLATGAIFAWQRRALDRAAFNLGLFALESSLAVVVWQSVVEGHDPLGPWGWLATGAAITCTSLLSSVAVTLAVTVSSGELPRIREVVSMGHLLDLANGAFALAIVYIVAQDWRAVWLVGVIAAMLIVSYRSQELARERAEALERLAGFSQVLSSQVELRALAEALVHEAARAFTALDVQLRIIHDEVSLLTSHGPNASRWPADLLELDSTPGSALLVGRKDAELRRSLNLTAAGIRDCMAVGLSSGDRALGHLVVANRGVDVSSYGEADLQQLRTVANNAVVAIENVLRSERLVANASTDNLTGLANRWMLGERLHETLQSSTAAVLILDLDRFQDVNNTLGHQMGDRLLCQIADRLRELLPEGALAARFDGDAFAVLLPSPQWQEAESLAWRLHELFLGTFPVAGVSVAIDASFGVAVGERGEDGESLVRRADLALYAAKRERTVVDVYRSDMELDSKHVGLLADLRDAVAHGDLEVYFQPQLDIATAIVDGAEALARWHHPQHGSISPEEFIPLAERSQLITPLTFLVLRRSLKALEHWRQTMPDFTVSVNVSPRSLVESDFVDRLEEVLNQSRVPAGAVTLEITETSLLASPDVAIAALARLRQLGVRLSVDDFGTGYSSLSYLHGLPVDEIKLDRSFLAALDDPMARALLRGVIDLGRRLRKSVVAEGVEDDYSLLLLREAGCERAQGYLIARPMPTADLTCLLSERAAASAG